MNCVFYREEDAIHVSLPGGPSAQTKQLDEQRYVGFNEDGELVWGLPAQCF